MRRGMRGTGLGRFAARAGDCGAYVRQVRRFVATRRWCRMQVARQQVRRIGFQQQPILWNAADERGEMPAPPLIAEPARDADRQAELQAIRELRGLAGEAVRDAAQRACIMLAQRTDEIRVRIALMQEQRLAALRGKFQLPFEGAALRVARREIAVVVKTAFADGNDFRMLQQRTQFRQILVSQLRGVMRMHSCGCEQHARVLTRQLQCRVAAREVGARDDDLHDTRGARAFDHRVAVKLETVMRQVGADVDPMHAMPDMMPSGKIAGKFSARH